MNDHCIHWSRKGTTGPGHCSAGHYGGSPYIGNCRNCQSKSFSNPGGDVLMTYDTTNLGDDIQALAMSELMPNGVRSTVFRKDLGITPVVGKIAISGWFKHPADSWPTAPGLNPLFVSFHAHDEKCVTEHVDFLKQHQPIGCRDLYTTELCLAHGIKAFWAGCVTMTLSRSAKTSPAGKNAVVVDYVVPGIKSLTQTVKNQQSAAHRLGLAGQRLASLASARCVVTSRLHIAIPCAALGVPVMLIHPEDVRFSGLSQFVHYRTSADDKEVADFIDRPLPNPNVELLQSMAGQMRERVREFFSGKPGRSVVSERKVREIAEPVTAGEWVEVRDEMRGLPPKPVPNVWHTGGEELFDPYQITLIPKRGVSTVKDGIVVKQAGKFWPVVDDAILADLTWWGGCRQNRMPLPAIFPQPCKIAGHALMLASDWSGTNYAHWLLDSIGRLSILGQAGMSVDDFDHIVMPAPNSPDVWRILRRIGIDQSRVIVPDSDPSAMQFDRLTTPTIDGVACHYGTSLPVFFQQLIGAQRFWTDKAPRVYVRRGKFSRHMEKEPLMEAIAARYGFVTVDPRDAGAMQTIASASIVVGAHGAGLASLAFCRPGAQFMEIMPDGHQQLYYRDISEKAGMRYSMIFAHSSQPELGRRHGWMCNAHVDVDLIKFEHCLCSLIAEEPW